MVAPNGAGAQIEHELFRCILDARDLFKYDVTLDGKIAVPESWVENHIGEDIDRHRQVLVQHPSVIGRVLACRVSIERAPERLDLIGDLFRGSLLRPLEHHVFEKMADAQQLARLVTRSPTNPNTNRRRAHAGNLFRQHDGAARQLCAIHPFV